MILNLRVDHKIANIDAMENIAKEMDQLFLELQEKYSIVEYVEIYKNGSIHVCFKCDDKFQQITELIEGVKSA